MKNWNAIAQASGLNLRDDERDLLTRTLTALEESFRPLAKDLTVDIEPATGVCGEEDSE